MKRILVLLLCLAAWVLALKESASRPRPAVAAVPVPAPHPRAPLAFDPVMSRVSVASPAPSVHSATAVELPDGTLRAFWFGGSREGARDVAIWSSDYDGSGWTRPWIAVDRERVAGSLRRDIRKLGNPVATCDAEGRVTLFVVSVTLGGWSGSSINRLVFAPDGKTLIAANRLVTSPLLNLGTLVRGAPLAAEGGGLLLPAYHETVKKFPQVLRISDSGRVVGRGGPAVRGDLFQPWMLADGEGNLDLFLRRGEAREAQVFHSRSEGGVWSVPAPIDVPNPNAGVSALRLDGGDLLLAANPDPRTRDQLVLLRAASPSGPWRTVFTVDTAVREEDERDLPWVEYSYPWLMRDRRGGVHLLYTWNRREIRHWCFDQEDLEGGAR